MFGLSKWERYESKVDTFLAAMFGAGDEGATLAKALKSCYSDSWEGVIREGLELGNTPEHTGAILSAIFYKDMILHEFTLDAVQRMREAIIAQDHSDDARFPFKLFYSALMMSVADDENISSDVQALWFRDIHRAIFDDDDTHLEDTNRYLFDGASDLRAQYKDLSVNA